MTVHVFTSAAFNYIPKARLLFQSLRKHHPEWVVHLALGDELGAAVNLDGEPFDTIMTLDQMEIPNWRGWAFCHTIVELCTAIKPFALKQLLRRSDCEKVLYFDPDIVLFSRVDDILASLDEANIALTPHLTHPENSLDKIIKHEICSLRHGVYNLGFIGVCASDEGRRFADWWAERTYHFCRDNIPRGLFTDQRWIDLVPAFFSGVAILRSPRLNLAPWNITTRSLTGTLGHELSVDGEALGFYHFTGFDTGAHLINATRYASDATVAFSLINWYREQIELLGRDPIAQIPWAFGAFSNGEKISAAQRLIYRENPDLQVEFPDPFDARGYLKWWKTEAPSKYPKLFGKSPAKELRKMASKVTPGFRGAASAGADRRASPKRPIRRGWEILRTEGVSGLVRSRWSS